MRTPLIVLNLAHAIPIIMLTIVPGIEVEGKTVYMSFFDAMYFVAYTATTIGFGEIPYAFSYEQRMVVFLTIYLSVPSWFYALGSIVALLQEKTFLNALKVNSFRRRVDSLNQDFILICGYNHSSKLLIDRLNQDNLYRIVVVDISNEKIEQLNTETYMPSIPSMVADASTTPTLKASGIQSPRCKYIITLFDDDQLNLKIAIRARILNEKIKILSRSNVKHGSENLTNIGVDHVIDIFDIIAKRIDAALFSPYLFNLISWIQGGNLHVSKSDILPTGKYIVCSGGRFGKTLQKILDKNSIEYIYVDLNKEVTKKTFSDKEFFLEADIENAACIVAGTNDDAVNLSIIATARAMNPRIFVIARENESEERSLFTHLRADKIFILDQIAAIDAYNYIDRPVTLDFLRDISTLDKTAIEKTLLGITQKVNKRPSLIEIPIIPSRAYALHKMLQTTSIALGQLLNNPYRDGINLEIVILGIKRKNGEFILLPDDTTPIEPEDHLLFATTKPSLVTFETIINHYYELYFVLNGVEEKRFKWLF
jgi:Trk K+ transport system NAD-binding subunit